MSLESRHDREHAPAAEPGGGPGLGQVLARARAEQGLSIPDVAEQLKFAPRQLDALEHERFGELPGSTFARGMVRAYARLLKLDAAPLLAQLDGKFDVPDANRLLARYSQPVPFSDNSRRSNVVYAVLSLVILAVVGGVAYNWHQERNRAASVAFVPAAQTPEVQAPAAPAVPAPVASVAAPVIETPKSAPPAAPAARAAEAPSAATLAAPAQTGLAGTRIVLRFEQESWVEVRDGSGQSLMAQLNPAGSVRVVRGEPPFALVVGNAQHVEVIYKDKAVDLKPHIRVEVARFTLE